jgi:hypothetical protein
MKIKDKLEQLLTNYNWNDLEIFAFFSLLEAKEHRKRMKKEKNYCSDLTKVNKIW